VNLLAQVLPLLADRQITDRLSAAAAETDLAVGILVAAETAEAMVEAEAVEEEEIKENEI
jgi:hypothetical protein